MKTDILWFHSADVQSRLIVLLCIMFGFGIYGLELGFVTLIHTCSLVSWLTTEVQSLALKFQPLLFSIQHTQKSEES
jgi:hypothetical protein